MILRDTLGDAVILSIFDFLMGFVVLYFIGLLIRSLKYIDVIERGKPELEIKVKSSKEASVDVADRGKPELKLKDSKEA